MARKIAINFGQRALNSSKGRNKESRLQSSSSAPSSSHLPVDENSKISKVDNEVGYGKSHLKRSASDNQHENNNTVKRRKEGVPLNKIEEEKSENNKLNKIKEESVQDIQIVMGFSSFQSTKNKHVIGTNGYGVNLNKKIEYRQYMNRAGGFNRPLSPTRGDKKPN